MLTALAADVIIAVGGSAGTLSELCFGWIHAKPMLLLEGYGGWSERFGQSPIDKRRSEGMTVCKDLDSLEQALLAITSKPGQVRR